MYINLEGRIRNINLSHGNSLLPLFEAVVNSIHAIEDRKIKNGYIKVNVLRDSPQSNLIEDGNFSEINGFSIIDNGIGFNSNNYDSFCTSDSLYKKSRGSKGIGRFLWLKAFKNVSIESIYEENNDCHKLHLEFNFQHDGVKEIDHYLINDKNKNIYTKISLQDFLLPYKVKCPQKIETIGKRILEHCIAYFVLDKVPTIRVIDGEHEFIINDYFSKNLDIFADNNILEIKGHKFNIKGFKYYDSSSSDHNIFYCANYRTVKSESLHKFIPDLIDKRKIKDLQTGKRFTYLAFISGTFLDNNVNQERTGFNNIQEKHEDLLDRMGYLSYEKIRENWISLISNNLSPFLLKIKEEKDKRIREFIVKDAIQYRPLLKYAKDKLDAIKPDLSNTSLDLELHKIKSELEISLKKKGEEVLSTQIENFDKYPDYRKKYHEFLEQYNDFGINKLAEYVSHRKIIIELFSNKLQIQNNNKYPHESDIHQIVFPMRSTSDDIGSFEKQNLWLIDERLSYHHYLASDKPLGKLPNFANKDASRPDIIIFNNPVVFVDSRQAPFSAVTIVEFKRPMRNNYSNEGDHPIMQVSNYIKKIQENNCNDLSGRPIHVQDNTPFYVYVICDLTKNIRNILEIMSYTKMPDGQGYFHFNNNLNAYFEVLSFDKVIQDAKSRNNILFDKLGI